MESRLEIDEDHMLNIDQKENKQLVNIIFIPGKFFRNKAVHQLLK